MNINAIFSPMLEGHYEGKIPVYLNKNYIDKSIKIVLRGKCSKPQIKFDRKDVILPIVPLGFITSNTFEVINCGYEQLMLKYKLQNQMDDLPIEIEPLDGLRMGVTLSRIRFKVTF